MGRVTISTGKSVNIQPQQAPGDEKLRWNWNTPIHVGAVSKALYTGAQYLYRSTDQGRNWTRISPDLTTNDKNKQMQEGSGGIGADNTSAENHCTIFTIAESPLDGNLIWAGTDDGNLQVTTDGGKTWVVLKGGEALEGYAHKIKEDPVNKDLLFLGTERGLYCTLNGGREWFRMKNNVPWYGLVRDIDIHPVTHDLVLGTHGRGIIVVDDIRPIRSMTTQTAEQPVVLFAPGTVKMTGGRFGGSGFPIQGGWNGGNPPAIPAIEYYLKERVMSSEVKIDILDSEGKLVQNMPGTKRKGINRVYWNQRMKPPKTAEGSVKLDFSSFLAPMVLPGTYTVSSACQALVIGNKLLEII